MNHQPCQTCGNAKAQLKCGLCECSLCKSCVQFVEPDQFSFYEVTPEALKHQTYCSVCYAEKVAPEIEKYEKLMELARDINVFEKSQGKETRLIKRTEKPITLKDQPDRDEAVLRLAFGAAQKGFNSLIDVNLTHRKVITAGRQTTLWNASGVPANVTSNRLVKDRSIWSNPN